MNPAEPRTAFWDHPTVRLNQSDITLAQSLGDRSSRAACLVLYSGAEPGRRFTLGDGTHTLGRAPDCQVPLDTAGTSRRHAELQVTGQHVMLSDLGSVNGTHVNERRVDVPVVLKDGDMLRLGDVLLKFFASHSLESLLHDRIYRMATVDAGTEVFSKRYVTDALEREVRRARRHRQPLAVMCFDLDHFKAVNDSFGHNAGDHALRETAVLARGQLRAGDILGRIGGEEFLAVLPDTTLADALALADRVRAALQAQTLMLPLPDGREQPHQQTASFGVAVLTPELKGALDLLGAADTRLYQAKHAGRNRVVG